MENNSIKYIVYCTTCTITKSIYIGVHKTNPDIFDGYIGNGCYINRPLTYDSPKTKYQYAIKKYGIKNFIRNTIAIFDNKEDAYLLEAEIVNKDFLTRSDVYNTALGGNGGDIMNTSIPTYQYDNNGNLIAEFNSIHEIEIKLNYSMWNIWKAIKDKTRYKNCFWTTTKYDKLDLNLMFQYEGPHKVPVFQFDENGNYECCYESIHDAERLTNMGHSNISVAIKTGSKCYNKYFTTTYSPTFDIAKFEQQKITSLYQYDLEGNFIKEYPSEADAKKEVLTKSSILKAIKLGRTCAGFQWSFEKLDKMPPIEPKTGRARKVGKYDKDWNLIETYDSLAQCKKENGASVEHVIRGRNEFSKGFRYKYLN